MGKLEVSLKTQLLGGIIFILINYNFLPAATAQHTIRTVGISIISTAWRIATVTNNDKNNRYQEVVHYIKNDAHGIFMVVCVRTLVIKLLAIIYRNILFKATFFEALGQIFWVLAVTTANNGEVVILSFFLLFTIIDLACIIG